MVKALEKPVIIIALLLILSLYLFFFQLDKAALTDPDETFYAQTAKEMIKKGEWITPYLYDKPQFEKPILFYWLVEASYKIFGINEFAARFPSAVFGFLGLVAVYFLGRLLFNNRVGIFSSVALATNIEYLILSNACVTDMVFSTCLLFGVLFFFCGQIKKKDYFYILSAAAFALAVLAKGPIGLLLPGFIIVIYLLLIRDFSIFKNWTIVFLSSVIFIVIALPWYAIMYKLHSKEFIDVFFGFHNVTRFLTPEHKTGSQIYYNIPIVLGGFFPWSVFLPLGFWQMFKGIRSIPPSASPLAGPRQARSAPGGAQNAVRNTRNASIFVLLWFAIIFIFFTISSTKLPTYIFPCFISLAVIVGKLWDDFLNMQTEKKLLSGMKISYYFLAGAVILLLIGGYIFIKMDYPAILGGSLIAGIFLLFGILLSFTAFIKKRFIAAFFLTAYMVVLAIYPASMLAISGIDGYESGKDISRVITSYFKEGDVIGSEKDFRPGLAFYTDKIPVLLENNEILLRLLKSEKRVWCVVKDKNTVDEGRIVYKFGEKRLLTNKTVDSR